VDDDDILAGRIPVPSSPKMPWVMPSLWEKNYIDAGKTVQNHALMISYPFERRKSPDSL
jgi:hypothetical protein